MTVGSMKPPDIAHLLRDDLRNHLLAEGVPPTRAEEITNYLVAVADAEGTRMRANRLEAENQRLRSLLAELLRHDDRHHGSWTMGMRDRVRRAVEA